MPFSSSKNLSKTLFMVTFIRRQGDEIFKMKICGGSQNT
jgi:hypothetical protein